MDLLLTLAAPCWLFLGAACAWLLADAEARK